MRINSPNPPPTTTTPSAANPTSTTLVATTSAPRCSPLHLAILPLPHLEKRYRPHLPILLPQEPLDLGVRQRTFYFHGSRDWDFCVFTDAGLHINAHFIGNHNPATSRDFTWIQALGIRFLADHRLYVGA
eukprot:XP_020398804.1 uncharacterized protein LOC109941941 [Zea mays]